MSFLWSFGSKKEPAVPASPLAPSQSTFKTMSNTFKKGVQYNMKIVLRGDVMTGKSNLFQRLQGLEFDENYTSTPQIEVTNIPWNYKDSPDIVKIEVWDVVDKAHNSNSNKSREAQGIKLEHNVSTSSQQDQQAPSPPSKDDGKNLEDSMENGNAMGLDAATVNVYRNTQGVILLFDTTKPWTFDYVNKELENVPENICVLVLGNFCDKVEERKVETSTIHAALYKHNQKRIQKGTIKPNLIRYAETSMKTGLGLQYIHEYLGVPYLQLVIETLNKQLELKAIEIVDVLENLDTNEDVPELMHRRRGQDNFVQPSDDNTILSQHDELKADWDEEMEAIAADHPSALESFHRRQTPPIPTEPVKSHELDSVALQTEDIPSVAVEGDDKIADDWFNEESNITETVAAPKDIANDDDDEDNESGNPMVQTDEDVEAMIYDNTASIENENKNDIEGHEESEKEHTLKPHDERLEEEEEKVEEKTPSPTYHSPFFKSELNDVWGNPRSELRRVSNTEIASDSDDEDNRIDTTTSADIEESSASSPAAFVNYGYEEIGGSNEENPWSTGKQYEREEEEYPLEGTEPVVAEEQNEGEQKDNETKETSSSLNVGEQQQDNADKEKDSAEIRELQPTKKTSNNNNSRKKKSGKKNRKRRN